jgi:TolB-like protein/DNA-binding winged helix-turn-helix (wHTH) protein/cytochrome c-type biogenesis protein CcmH/NrfG
MGESRSTYQFGPFRLHVDRRLLLRDGVPVSLSPKALETLLALLEHRERVLTKDELLQRIWGDTVVEEGGLTRNVSILRKALGESPDDHRYIVTVPGRGYRFVADAALVDETGQAEPAALTIAVPENAPDDAAATVPVNAASAPAAAALPWRRWVVAVAAVLAAGALMYSLRPRRAIATGRPQITALAVLPLENLSGDPSQEYFADGMTEALIANLAHIRAVRVVSRTSVMRFKGAARSLPEIARALAVDAVIEGSVQRSRDRVRINVQLVHAPSDTHLWARQYERELIDVLKLQADVARAVVDEIQVQITAEERARLAAADAVDVGAYQEYLLGQHYLWRLDEEDLTRAISHFDEAIRRDPNYAAAHAGLSHAWWWRGVWGAKTLKQVEAPSRAAARKALELDGELAEAHVSMGRILFGYDWDWSAAEKHFRRALEIDPNNRDAHFFSGMLFMALGRFAEAITHVERAERLDPLSAAVQSAVGRVLYRAHRFDEAIVHLNDAIELEPQTPGNYHRLADVYEEIGRYDEALDLHRKEDALLGRAAGGGPAIARIYARMGKTTEARRMLAAPRAGKWTWLESATLYAALGDKDDAFRSLSRMFEEREGLNYVKTDPRLDSLHADPRWQVLLRRMNFPPDADATASTAVRDQPATAAK